LEAAQYEQPRGFAGFKTSPAAFLLPISPRHGTTHEAARTRLLTMEFRTFLDEIIHSPCQIIRHARTVVLRLLNWTDMTPAFFRLCDSLLI